MLSAPFEPVAVKGETFIYDAVVQNPVVSIGRIEEKAFDLK